jgi:hypothetical protein
MPTPDPISIPPTIKAPDLHGSGEAVTAAAAKLFGGEAHLPEADAPVEQEAAGEAQKPVGEAPKVEGTEAKTEDPLNFEALRQVAAARAAERAAKEGARQEASMSERLAALETETSSLRGDAEKFRQLQGMADASPLALMEALGLDPIQVAQNLHREAINKDAFSAQKTASQLAAEVKELKARLEEVESGKAGKITAAEQNARAAANRREFVALTEDAEHYPLLAAEQPEARLEMTTEAVRLLVEADQEITHAAVAKVIESKLRADLQRRMEALGLTVKQAPAASSKKRAGIGSATIDNSLSGEQPAERPKTERERDRAAEKLAAKLFGLSPN